MLTVLLSLKPLALVSETRISFSNYAYLLTVLSSLKLVPPVSRQLHLFAHFLTAIIIKATPAHESVKYLEDIRRSISEDMRSISEDFRRSSEDIRRGMHSLSYIFYTLTYIL